jgi:hypothetical protein
MNTPWKFHPLYAARHIQTLRMEKKENPAAHNITAGKVVVSRQITWKVVSAAVSAFALSVCRRISLARSPPFQYAARPTLNENELHFCGGL